MIKQFKKLLVLFLLIGSHQLIYSQTIPNTDLSLNSTDFNGKCAPDSIFVGVNWPENNSPSTEYIFILHDDGDSDPVTSSIYQVFSFFHSDSLPETIPFSFTTSSCNANNSSYVVDYFVKDTLSSGAYASVSGANVGTTVGIYIYGELQADFTTELVEDSCGVYTFTNTSVLGESLGDDNSCADSPVETIEWFIDTDPSNYSIITGSLGDGPASATSSITIKFAPGDYDITILSNNFDCSDFHTSNICVEEYNFNLDDLNINIPDDTVCVNAPIIIENDIDEINYSCLSTNEDWFEWNLSQIDLTCLYDDELVINDVYISPTLFGSNPSLSIPNPGRYEIRFNSTHPCIDPPIEFIDTITVQGHPIVDTISYELIQNCDLSASLSIDFDTCNSEPPYSFEWSIEPQEFGSIGDNSVNETNLIFENSGDYTIEYIIGSENESCGVDTAYFEVSISDTLSLSLPNDTSICGESLTISPDITAGVPEFDYLWEYNGETSINPELELSNIDTDIEVVLQVTDSDDPNCLVRDTMQILIAPTPSYTLDSLFTKCEGVDIEISFNEEVQDGDIVLWEFNTESDTLIYDLDQDSLINVSVTSSFQCVYNDSTLVEFSSIDEDFINFPDTIVFCSLGEHMLLDTIDHPTILTKGFLVW